MVSSPLLEAGLAVSAVVVGVDGISGGDEPLSEVFIAHRVLAETMGDLHDADRHAGFPVEEVDRHAVRIDERALLSRGGELNHRSSLLNTGVFPGASV